jgi:hypothetical protein
MPGVASKKENSIQDPVTVDFHQAAQLLDTGVIAGPLHSRIYRKSHKLDRDAEGRWQVPLAGLHRALITTPGSPNA